MIPPKVDKGNVQVRFGGIFIAGKKRWSISIFALQQTLRIGKTIQKDIVLCSAARSSVLKKSGFSPSLMSPERRYSQKNSVFFIGRYSFDDNGLFFANTT